MAKPNSGPLAGIRVLDIGTFITAPPVLGQDNGEVLGRKTIEE